MPVAKDVHTTTSASVHRDHPTTSSTTSMSVSATTSARPGRPVSPTRADADAHLLRLCLGLQLDAMLLTIGAAAANERRNAEHERRNLAEAEATGTAEPPAGPAAPPWNRWVTEDMDMVCALAVDVMNRGAALPANLGSDLDHAVPAAAVDNLIARYESMSALLADVRQLVSTDAAGPQRALLESVLERCERRLNELRASRLEHTPPRGLDLTLLAEQPSLRGEWLG